MKPRTTELKCRNKSQPLRIKTFITLFVNYILVECPLSRGNVCHSRNVCTNRTDSLTQTATRRTPVTEYIFAEKLWERLGLMVHCYRLREYNARANVTSSLVTGHFAPSHTLVIYSVGTAVKHTNGIRASVRLISKKNVW